MKFNLLKSLLMLSLAAPFIGRADTYILDNVPDASSSGTWSLGTSAGGKYGADYWFASTVAGNATYTATYAPNIATAGLYDVYVWYSSGSNRALNAPHTISYNGGSLVVPVNQTVGGGNWFLIASCKPFAAGTAGYVRIANNTGASGSVVIADAVKFVSSLPPTITTQPINKTVCSATAVTFTVSATGSATLAYQWLKDGVNLAGATSSALTFSSVTSANQGSYTVVVSNPAGSTTSSAATLVVKQAPAITAQPQSQSLCPGSSVTFAVTATGTSPLTYQWRFNSVNQSGATQSTYSRANVTTADAGTYSVVINNSCGSATSTGAALTLNTTVSIITPPQPQTLCAGANAQFTVQAGGTAPFSYQWTKNGVNMAGATQSSLTLNTVSSGAAGVYGVTVNNTCGSASASAQLTVIDPISIATQPQGQAVAQGDPASFTVVAAGTAPSYQWRFNSADIAGETTSALTIPTVAYSDVGAYSVAVQNTCGTVISSVANLTISRGLYVDIGADQTITLPDALHLVATVHDDGLPSGNTISLNWYTVSGPVSAAFASPNNADTMIYFGRPGTYVLGLSADDGELIAQDEITVVVNAEGACHPFMNGSFEDGMRGWAFVDGAGVFGPPYVSSVGMDGPHALELGGGNLPGVVVSQTFCVVPGASYRLTFEWGALGNPLESEGSSFRVEVNAGATILQSEDFNDSAPTVEFPMPPDSHWQGSLPFTVPPRVTSVTLSFADVSPNDGIAVDGLLDAVSVNRVPTANAGPDRMITLPNGVALAGVADDDGLPNTHSLDVHWQKVSGPGAVDFTPSGAAQATAYFGAPGTYVLRLVADDSEESAYDDVTIVVNAESGCHPFMNGSFEEGLEGWSFNDGVLAFGPPLVSSVGIDGNYSGTMRGSDFPGASLSQTFCVAPGKTYTLGFEHGAAGEDWGYQSKIRVEVKTGAGTLISTDVINSTPPASSDDFPLGPQYHSPASFAFKVPANATTATIIFTANSAPPLDAFIDKVAVSESSFSLLGDQYVQQDCGARSVSGFASSSLSQPVTYTTAVDNQSLFAVTPSISPDGTLIYTPTAGATGTAIVQVRQIDGSTQVGAAISFRIVVSPAGSLVWRYNAGVGTTANCTTPAVGDDGSIYLGVDGVGLVSLQPNGSVAWAFPGVSGYSWQGGLLAPTIGDDGTIFAADGNLTDGHLYAVNPDGTLKWQKNSGSATGSPSVGRENVIYFPTKNGITAVNGLDGTTVWDYTVPGVYVSSPGIDRNGNLYFGVSEASQYRLQALTSDGVALWSYPVGNRIMTSPSIGADGSIYFGANDFKIYCLSVSGALKWSYTTGNQVKSFPVIGANGVVYVGSDDRNMYALNGETGVPIWSFASQNVGGAWVQSTAALDANGTLYFGSHDGQFYAVNSAGSQSWAFQLFPPLSPLSLRSSAAIAPNGLIYYSTPDGYLYAFQGSANLATTQWPMVKHNLHHTGQVKQTRKVVVNGDYNSHQGPDAQFTVDRAPAGWEPWAGGDNNNSNYKALNINPPYGDVFLRTAVDKGFPIIDNYSAPVPEDAGYYALTHGSSIFCFHDADNSRHYFDYKDWFTSVPERAARGPFSMAIVAGGGLSSSGSINSWGPQGEFLDSVCYSAQGNACGCVSMGGEQSYAFSAAAAKYATVLDAHPAWNPFDIRQYMRQVSTFYNQIWTDPKTSRSFKGWRMDGGYGFVQIALRCGGDPIGTPVPTGLPPLAQVSLNDLEVGPPLIPRIEIAADRQSVTFYWKNWLQTGFKSTVIKKSTDGVEAHATDFYETLDKTASSFNWAGPVNGNETFYFYTKLKNGHISRSEAFTEVSAVGPTITTQPASATVESGTPVALSVVANDPDPLNLFAPSYQWYHDGIAVPYATGPSLGLNNVQPVSAGNYTVKISNRFSWTVSSVATLQVLKVATPTFSPDTGRYLSLPSGVAISCSTPGASIHYTINGTAPTISSPIIVSGDSIPVTATTTIKAQAYLSGYGASDIKEATYTIPHLIATADNKVKLQGSANPVLTGTLTGILDNDNITATYSTSATGSSPVGTYAITPSLIDPDGKLPSYNVTLVSGTLKVVNFSIKGDQYVRKDCGPQTVTGFATTILSEAVSYATVAANPSLFAVQPSISADGILTYTPIAGAVGKSVVTVQLLDANGVANGPALSFTITVNAPGSLNWEFSTGIVWDYGIKSSAAIGNDGTIYFGARDKGVFALNPDGSVKWNFPSAAGYSFARFSPAIGNDGTIYAGNSDGGLYAINPDGTQKWRTYVSFYEGSPSIGADGTIYCGSNGTGLNAIRPSDGAVLWRYNANGQYIYSGPAIGGNGNIYFGATDNRLHAIDHDGNFLWSYETGGLVISSPAIGLDGSIYFGAMDGNAYCLNSDGTLKWSFTTGADVASVVIGDNGVVYFGSENGNLYAVNASTGAQVWVYNALSGINGSPALCSDGTIYVLAGGRLRNVNADGTLRWTFTGSATFGSMTSPVIAPNGTVYYGSGNGHFYAVQGAAPLASTPWPMFKRDLHNTGKVSYETPAIVQQPVAQQVNDGDNATFTVQATGGNLTYQWQKDGQNLTEGGTVSGSTTATLTLTAVTTTAAGNYRVVVVNGAGSVTSTDAALQVIVAPQITSQPRTQEANVGGSANFVVTATGDNLTYQWRQNGVGLPGANAARLSLQGLQVSDNGYYSCVVANSAGAVTSQSARLTVIQPLLDLRGVTVTTQLDPPAIILHLPFLGNYTICRRLKGETDWGSPIAKGFTPGPDLTFTDADPAVIHIGSAFEYKVDGGLSEEMLVYAGIAVPIGDEQVAGGETKLNRGKIILLVDRSMLDRPTLAPKVDRLERDLVADGWTVLRHDVERAVDSYDLDPDHPDANRLQVFHRQLRDVRSIIQADYAADRANVKSIFLLGKIAVPYSQANPGDGHGGRAIGHDLFYADVDSYFGSAASTTLWTDLGNFDRLWETRHWNSAGDEKFDQLYMPSLPELAIGRVDFHDMNIFFPALSSEECEQKLLERYLDKDSAYRNQTSSFNQGQPVARRVLVVGLPELQAGDVPRQYAPVFGKANITLPTPAALSWFPILSQNDYLFAHGTGWGSHESCAVVGTTGPSGPGDNNNFVTVPSKAVFSHMYGSFFLDWNCPNNLMRGVIANDGLGLANWWGTSARSVRFMALGETIGYSVHHGAFATNYVTGLIQSVGWLNLMGDPSLRMHVVNPPQSLSVAAQSDKVVLNWNASSEALQPAPYTPGLVGYNIYRATHWNGTYTLLNSTPVQGLSFEAPADPAGAFGAYMVRAVKFEETASGTYYNTSQGVLATVTSAQGPTITAQPVNRIGVSGDRIAFTVHAYGTDAQGNNNLTYQWQKLVSGSWVDVSGATASELALTAGTDTLGDYSVVVSGATTVRSATATLSLNTAPTAVNDSFTIYRNTAIELDVLSNDSDADGGPDPLGILSMSAPGGSSQAFIIRNPSHDTISYKPALNWIGTQSFTYVIKDGPNTAQATVTMNVIARPDNQAPAFSVIPDQVTYEDTQKTIALELTDETPVEDLTVAATSSNSSLLPNSNLHVAFNGGQWSLSMLPARDQFGSSTITVIVTDGDGAPSSRSFTLAVYSVNDRPTLDVSSEFTIKMNGGATQVFPMRNISSGSPSEVETLTVTAVSLDHSLLPDPAVNYVSPQIWGSLTLTPVEDASGVATIRITVSDGQTENGSITKDFTVVIGKFKMAGDQYVAKDGGPQTVSSFAVPYANIPSTFSTMADDPSLFSSAPAISSGDLHYTPATGRVGRTAVHVQMQDQNGNPDGPVQNFSIIISPVRSQLWTFTNVGTSTVSSPALAPDGTIYVGIDGAGLNAVNPDGSLKWIFTGGAISAGWTGLSSSFMSPVVGPDGTIYAASRISSGVCPLYAINPNGTEKWHIETERSGGAPALSNDGILYYTTGSTPTVGYLKAGLHAVRASDGSAVSGRSYIIPGVASATTVFVTTPVINQNGDVYFCVSVDGQSYLQVLRANGTDARYPASSTLSGPVSGSPVIGADGSVYFAWGNSIYGLNPDCSEKWHFDAAVQFVSSPLVAKDNTIYCGNDGGKLYAVNGDTGLSKWTYVNTLQQIQPPGVLDITGDIYFYDRAGNMRSLSSAGDDEWTNTWSPQGILKGSSVISPTGVLYTPVGAGIRGALTAHQVAKPADSAWPMAGQNAQRTGWSGPFHLQNGTFLSGGAFQFTIPARAGNTLTIDASLDNQTWTQIHSATVPAGADHYGYVDTGATLYTARFYRVALGNGIKSDGIGFIKKTVPALEDAGGRKLFGGQLIHGSGQNTLSTVLPTVPEGTEIWKFIEAQVTEQSVFSNGKWSVPHMTVNPGEAFWFLNPLSEPYPVNFIGTVPEGHLVRHVPYGYSSGSSIVPQAGLISTQLLYPASEGDTISRASVNSSGGFAYQTEYFDEGAWTAEPNVEIGEGYYIYNASADKDWTRDFKIWP